MNAIKRHMIVFAAAAALALLALTPNIAHAGILDDLDQIMIDACNAELNNIYESTRTITEGTPLLADFDNIMGDGGSLHHVVTTTMNVAVEPIAEVLLVLAALLQLFRISQRVGDGGNTFSYVRDILMALVMFVICSLIVFHTQDICEGIYALSLQITKGISTGMSPEANAQWVPQIPDADVADNPFSGGLLLVLTISSIFSNIIMQLLSVLIRVMVLARGLQIYAMLLLAPIPLALLAFEQTRQIAVGFLKSFASVALAGTIMYFCLLAYPYLLNTIALATFPASGNVNITDVLITSWVTGSLMLSVVLAWSVVHAGSWAQAIFN